MRQTCMPLTETPATVRRPRMLAHFTGTHKARIMAGSAAQLRDAEGR